MRRWPAADRFDYGSNGANISLQWIWIRNPQVGSLAVETFKGENGKRALCGEALTSGLVIRVLVQLYLALDLHICLIVPF